MTMMNAQRQMDFDNGENSRGRANSLKYINTVVKVFAKLFSKSGARRVGMFFDTLTKTFAVLSAVLLMWLLISWVDFGAHNLATDFSPLDDLWLGGANLVYLICSCM